MKNFIYTLAVITMMAPSLASAMDVNDFEKNLNLVDRLAKGTIQADVDRVQTYLESDDKGIPVWKLNLMKSAANMRAVRYHVNCVLKPTECKMASPR